MSSHGVHPYSQIQIQKKKNVVCDEFQIEEEDMDVRGIF